MVKRSPSRRRARRVRVTVAVGMLAASVAVAVAALVRQSTIWLSIAVVIAVACGSVATRLVYLEVLQGRREDALERARLAEANSAQALARSQENVAFAEAMSRKVTRRDATINELEGTIRLAEKRATIAEDRARNEASRANEANAALAELQQRVADAKAELVDELAVWEGAELDTVVDLMKWEERVMTKAEIESLRGEQKQA